MPAALNTHSCFSLARGADRLEHLCTAARARGFDTLALTDRNGLYGLVRFLALARRHGLAPIVGAEAVTVRERAVLLARDAAGYASLCRILSALHAAARPIRHLIDEPEVPGACADDATTLPVITPGADVSLADLLARHRDGLFILSDHLPLLTAVRALCGPDGLFHEMRHSPRVPSDFPPVATSDVHFVDPGGWHRHVLLRAIARNTTLPRLRRGDPDLADPRAWLRPPGELAHAFRDLPEAVANIDRIAAACRTDWSFDSVVQPVFPLPPGTDAFVHLRTLVEVGACRRYGAVDARVRARLEHEFALIHSKGFVHYFLVVHDLVHHARRHCGRGSAAASLVAYCLGITHVDPIRHNLYFERFLNPGRNDPPDIDIDFPWDERDSVLAYVFSTYGRSHAAMIANHVTFQPRAAVREVAKVYGMPDAEIADLTDRLGWFWEPHGLSELIEHHPLFRDVDLRPPWPEILRRAQDIVGFPRHLSVHCGGVVITPRPITDYVPIEPAPKGVDIIHWEKDAAEDAGLVKIDLLGNRSLAVIRDAVAAVADHTGRRIDFAEVRPLDDAATIALLAEGRTMGVFYVESPAMRQLQQKTHRGDFEHLVLHSSIIRPAANAYIREYVRRLHGGTWEPLHPAFEEILRESYGVMSYQEDISKVAIALAGFDVTDADRLRRILSKKDHAQTLLDYRQRFFAGALARGVAQPAIEAVWGMIESFRGYSFCKPHSASYAMVSFESAWLRAHYPAEFMAAVISNQGGYYTTFAYVSEARRMGLTVRPPDINTSRREWTGQARELRIGLMQVRGLKRSATDAVLAVQADGPFRSIEDFLTRVPLDPGDTRLLIRAGAFDTVGDPPRTRPELLWRLRLHEAGRQGAAIPSTAHSRSRAGGKSQRCGADATQLSLFPTVSAELIPTDVPAYDQERMLAQEVETLGFLASRHPLSLYEGVLKHIKTVPAVDLKHHVGRRVTVLGWWVTGKVVQTKKGEPMEFVSFEDTTEIYEATFFPEPYARFCRMLSRARPYLITGLVEADFGAVTVTVEQVRFVPGGMSGGG